MSEPEQVVVVPDGVDRHEWEVEQEQARESAAAQATEVTAQPHTDVVADDSGVASASW